MADLESSIDRVLTSRLRSVHTSFPGKVQSYDEAKRTADIIPMITPTIPGVDDEDEDLEDPLPVLMGVPVMFPRAGGAVITFPVSAGDTMLVVLCERDIGRWRATGEREVPDVPTLHGLSGAVAIPGLYPTGASAPTFTVAMKSDRMEVDGASDAAALASAVKTVIDAFCDAVPAPTDGGAALQTAVKAAWLTLGESVASQKLLVGG